VHSLLKCFICLSSYFKGKFSLLHKPFLRVLRVPHREVKRIHGNRGMTSTVIMAMEEWIANSLNVTHVPYRELYTADEASLCRMTQSPVLCCIQIASPEFCLKQCKYVVPSDSDTILETYIHQSVYLSIIILLYLHFLAGMGMWKITKWTAVRGELLYKCSCNQYNTFVRYLVAGRDPVLHVRITTPRRAPPSSYWL
jgi:hypothetical protein